MACGPWLCSGFVERLLAGADERCMTSLVSLGVFRKGRNVQVNAGPVAGLIGEFADVLERGMDRVTILLDLLGAKTSMELSACGLETV